MCQLEAKSKTKQPQSGEFHARKIARSGNARYIAVSRILPKDWNMVKLSVVKLEEDECILRLVKLM